MLDFFNYSKLKSKVALVYHSSNLENHSLPKEFSWENLNQLTTKLAYFLITKNIKSQQIIAFFGESKLAQVLFYLASIVIKTPIIIINNKTTSYEISELKKIHNITLIFNDADFYDFLNNKNSFASICDFTIDNQAIATVTLTSGSTGASKLVAHNIAQHFANAKAVCEILKINQNSSYFLSLPLHHIAGQAIIWRWLFSSSTLVINENNQNFYSILANVSHASLVATQLFRYLKQFKIFKSQTLLLGASAIDDNLINQAQTKGLKIFTSYGMTEMASAIAIKNSNCVQILPNRDLKIVNNEIWIKGAGLALGYLQNNKLLPLTNSEGYFATKDCGFFDENNNLQITGRLDNQFISGGENIQPEEIEKILLSSQLIKQILILPQKSEEFGEIPIACVEFNSEFNDENIKKLQDFSTKHLPKFKQPKKYLQLPNYANNNVKISRHKIHQLLKDQLNEAN